MNFSFFKTAKEPEDVKKRYDLIWYYYINILPEIAHKLNSFHKCDFSVKYWEILIGPWLAEYLTIVYEEFQIVKERNEFSGVLINKNYSKIYEQYNYIGFWHNNDYEDIIRNIVNSIYFNRIIQRKYFQKKVRFSTKFKGYTKLFILFIKKIRKLNYKSKSVGVTDAFYKNLLNGDIAHKFQKKIEEDPSILVLKECEITNFTSANLKIREDLFSGKSSNEVVSVFWNSLIYCFPIFFLESYSYTRVYASLIYPNVKLRKINLLFELHDTLLLKFFVAKQIELNNCCLAEFQHGGAYGLVKYLLIERISLNIVDLFYTWGWSIKQNKKIKPTYNIKKLNFEGKLNVVKGRKIFYCTTVLTESLRRISLTPQTCDQENYIKSIIKFINSFDGVKSIDLVWRPDLRLKRNREYMDYILLRLKQGVNYKRDESINFHQMLNNSNLFITDYCSTTLLEAFAADIPTIFFWDPKWMPVRENVLPIFDKLKENGLYHETPENASLFVKRNIDRIYDWWNSESVCAIKDEFKFNFSRVGDPEEIFNEYLTNFNK